MKKIIMVLMVFGIAAEARGQGILIGGSSPENATISRETAEGDVNTVTIGSSLKKMAVPPYNNIEGLPEDPEDAGIPYRNIYMYGANPATNSYEQDLAILNRRYRITPDEVETNYPYPQTDDGEPVQTREELLEERVETINMRGTNPRQNSYEEDLAILNRYDKMRGKR